MFVTSSCAVLGKIDPSNIDIYNKFYECLPLQSTFKSLFGYGQAKLCAIIFTMEIAKLLRNEGVLFYSAHPGMVKTEIFNVCHGWEIIWINVVLMIYAKVIVLLFC